MNRAGPAVTTVAEALNQAAAALSLAGVEQPRLDARLLLAHALGIGPERAQGQPERRLHADALRRLEGLTARRARREPVARLIGRREFWSLSLRVTPDTLDPRPDSETVVEAALAALDAAGLDRGREFRLLDLGTGTGCLLLALLRELPNAHGIGVDIEPGACATAAANAESLGLGRRAGFVTGDWGRGHTQERMTDNLFSLSREKRTIYGESRRYRTSGAIEIRGRAVVDSSTPPAPPARFRSRGR